MKTEVTAIIQRFEKEAISEEDALYRIRELCGREIDGGWLRNYWRSESLDEFVDRVCAAPIQNIDQLTESDVVALIAELLATQSPGRRDRIGEALELRYGKPAGTVLGLVIDSDLNDPDQILAALRTETKIYL